MHSLIIGLTLIALSRGAEIGALNKMAAESENTAMVDPKTALQPQSPNDRDDKFLSVFQIVKFNNDMCAASDGSMGVCFTEAECSSKGGVATGPCASAFGVCCVFKAQTCSSTVSQLVTYVESPNYPSAAPAGMCMYNIGKCDAGVCQYKISFEDVVLSDPDMGDCSNDTLTISNLDGVSTALMPNPLCGVLSGSEVYVTVKDTTADPKFSFNHVSGIAKWRIKVTQIQCKDTENLADPGCLTWNTGTSGTIMSFNNQGGSGELINNQKFSHCIKYQDGFCDVSLQSSDFMMGADDFVSIGGVSFTGSNFGTAGALTWNFTGPYTIPVCSGSSNAMMDSGYSINYLLLPC